jgi:hypothetical protein
MRKKRHNYTPEGKVDILERHLVEGVLPNIFPRPFRTGVRTEGWAA